jgi:hypothetical protein
VGLRADEAGKANEKYLSAEIRSNIAQSEIEGGVWVKDLAGKVIEVQTRNTLYTIDFRGEKPLISGNARFCPEPTECSIAGSPWGGSLLKMGFIGRGMYLEFSTNDARGITTSQIQEVREK